MDFLNIEKYAEVIDNPRKFIEEFIYITTKDGKFVKMKLNKPQDRLMKIIEKKLEENAPIRIRVLKSRQMGFSTLISALGFWWAAMHENSSYAVVAHKESSASAIFEKNKIFFDNLPKVMRPRVNRFNSERISFNVDGTSDYDTVGGLRSKIFFGTAGGGELFRGETILFMHKSECAFYIDPDGILKKSLNATVPYTPFSCIIEETTANGYNEWKDSWDRSVRGEDDYVPLFVGWNEMEEYSMKPKEGWKMSEKDLKYQLENDLTDAQMYWRRFKIENDYDGNEQWFMQEYPLTPEEAFISSGLSAFDGEDIRQGYKLARNPKFEKALESVIIKEKLKVWEEPEEKLIIEYQQKPVWSDEKQDYVYVDTDLEISRKKMCANYTLAIDTSGFGTNFNQFTVWNNITKRMVARLGVLNMREGDIAKVAVEIARYYNNAMIVPEVNYSHAVCDYIIDEGYDNIYFTENPNRVDKVKQSVEYGWSTTKSTKPMIISNLRRAIHDDPSIIPDKDFWYEAEYYIIEDAAKNITNAAKRHYDDIVMSCAIGNYVCSSFQAKQFYSSKIMVKHDEKPKNDGIMIGENVFDLHKKGYSKKLTKGVYTNNA